ncbi:hypothetical protein LshimejAT787_1003430 [Lyophyllum shimeji]|uniref:Tropomyosin n=1 Tax=Lyophyllum shimeji TaxID=47721 RepID=A0A9P3PTH4_LYOSH|nr:hypothetical protein LshimejAT787_1003430 [Lyophyllum shimeji]
MEGLRQALDKLRTEVDKGISRRKEADSRSKILATQLQEKDDELHTLRQRLDLTRQFLTLATKWNETRRTLDEHAEKIALANAKAEQLSDTLRRVEHERDTFEALYLDMEAKAKALDAQLHDLLS